MMRRGHRRTEFIPFAFGRTEFIPFKRPHSRRCPGLASVGSID